MENKTTYIKLKSNIDNSHKILASLFIFSLFGTIYGLMGIFLTHMWVVFQLIDPLVILVTSFLLFVISYFTFRNTQNLTETIEEVVENM